MAKQMATGAMLTCSFGVAPSTLNALPNRVLTTTPAATIMDNKPFVNLPPFGMCSSPANPAVAAATAAALGVLTPMPCMPPPAFTPWLPGMPTTLIAGQPALTNMSKCVCPYGGIIQATTPGQFTTDEG